MSTLPATSSAAFGISKTITLVSTAVFALTQFPVVAEAYTDVLPTWVVLSAIVAFFSAIVSMVAGFWWLYRAKAVANQLVPQFEFSPGGTVVWFFVPIAQLWLPMRAVAELWRQSEPDVYQSGTNDWVKGWWAAAVTSMIANAIPTTSSLTSVLIAVVMALSSVLWLVLVVNISARLDAVLARRMVIAMGEGVAHVPLQHAA